MWTKHTEVDYNVLQTLVPWCAKCLIEVCGVANCSDSALVASGYIQDRVDNQGVISIMTTEQFRGIRWISHSEALVMLPLSEVMGLVTALAAGNNTDDLLPSVVGFIKLYYKEFRFDYIPCKNVLNGRFKKGKLEEVLIYLFAELCNWSNTDENLRSVHTIMIGLGYYSYEVSAKRYRQMVENAKKDVKRNTRIRNRIRNLHSKVVGHKPIICKEYKRRMHSVPMQEECVEPPSCSFLPVDMEPSSQQSIELPPSEEKGCESSSEDPTCLMELVNGRYFEEPDSVFPFDSNDMWSSQTSEFATVESGSPVLNVLGNAAEEECVPHDFVGNDCVFSCMNSYMYA